MADSTPPKDSEPNSTPSDPPPELDEKGKPSDEGAPSEDELDDESDDESDDGLDSDSDPMPNGPVSLVELDIEPDPSMSGRKQPTKPPPPPTKKGSSPPPDGGRKLPEPTFKSQVPEPPVGASLVPPRRFPPETVGDIMTRKLIALTQTDTVENIESGMKRFRFRHLPVVNKKNELLGLVTQRDLLKAEADHALAAEGNKRLPKSTPVTEVMNPNILTTPPDMDLATAGKAMLQKKIGCLPVMLEDKTLVGIVTEADFVKLVIQMLDQDSDDEHEDEE